MAIYWKFNSFTGKQSLSFEVDNKNFPIFVYEIHKLRQPSLKGNNLVPKEHWLKVDTYKDFRYNKTNKPKKKKT